VTSIANVVSDRGFPGALLDDDVGLSKGVAGQQRAALRRTKASFINYELC